MWLNKTRGHLRMGTMTWKHNVNVLAPRCCLLVVVSSGVLDLLSCCSSRSNGITVSDLMPYDVMWRETTDMIRNEMICYTKYFVWRDCFMKYAVVCTGSYIGRVRASENNGGCCRQETNKNKPGTAVQQVRVLLYSYSYSSSNTERYCLSYCATAVCCAAVHMTKYLVKRTKYDPLDDADRFLMRGLHSYWVRDKATEYPIVPEEVREVQYTSFFVLYEVHTLATTFCTRRWFRYFVTLNTERIRNTKRHLAAIETSDIIRPSNDQSLKQQNKQPCHMDATRTGHTAHTTAVYVLS